MIFLILGCLDWALLVWAGEYLFSVREPLTPYSSFVLRICVFGGVWGIPFFFQSPLGIRVIFFLRNAHPLLKKEERRVKNLLEEVQRKIHCIMGVPPLEVMIFCEDSVRPYSYALGTRSLVLSRGALEGATDFELKGALAHELAYLHRGYAQKDLCVWSLSFLARGSLFCFEKIQRGLIGIVNGLRSSSREDTMILGLKITVMVFFGLLKITELFIKISRIILKSIFHVSHEKQVFGADFFAVQAGFGPGLRCFLEKIRNFKGKDPLEFLGNFYDLKTAYLKRFAKIEEGAGL